MSYIKIIPFGILIGLSLFECNAKENSPSIHSWTTSWNGNFKLSEQKVVTTTRDEIKNPIVIHIDPETKHQPILGFGGTFTDADVYNFMRMNKPARTAALKALFDPKDGAGWNLMRISFGSTDWDRNWSFYTYDDRPKGQKDAPLLSHFSVNEDRNRGHFELLHEALKINPNLKIHAAVWGPPAWMKDNDKLISDGTILPEHYEDYALYLAKCIQAYAAEGIKVMAISPQNETLCNDGRLTPQAIYMGWKAMRDLVKTIKNKFIQSNLDTQVWIFDHNFNYAKTWVEPFITDSSAKGSFDGVAWHDYAGSENELGELSAKYPDIPMYHTERAHYTTNGLMRVLRILRCGARSHNHWITISDEYGAPFQYQSGSDKIKSPVSDVDLKAIYNLRDNSDKWVKTPGYYTFAQLSKFVKRGAVRIDSDDSGSVLANTAFQNPDGSIVVVVVNCGKEESSFVLAMNGNYAQLKLPPDSAGTYVFIQ